MTLAVRKNKFYFEIKTNSGWENMKLIGEDINNYEKLLMPKIQNIGKSPVLLNVVAVDHQKQLSFHS